MAIKRSNDKSGIKWVYVAVGLLILLIGVGAFFGYQKYDDLRKENQRLSNPEEATKSEIENTKSSVSALIEVPTDEEPTIANVVDVTKLSDQEFFKNAQNGDKLLVYQNAKKAILYRPSTNKIIEVSTIDIGKQDATTNGGNDNNSKATDKTKTESPAITEDQPGLQ